MGAWSSMAVWICGVCIRGGREGGSAADSVVQCLQNAQPSARVRWRYSMFRSSAAGRDGSSSRSPRSRCGCRAEGRICRRNSRPNTRSTTTPRRTGTLLVGETGRGARGLVVVDLGKGNPRMVINHANAVLISTPRQAFRGFPGLAARRKASRRRPGYRRSDLDRSEPFLLTQSNDDLHRIRRGALRDPVRQGRRILHSGLARRRPPVPVLRPPGTVEPMGGL
jgi:hypothetical protein